MYEQRMKLYLNDSVNWERKSGQDAYAQPTYSEGIAIAARKERKARMVRDSLGNEVVSDTTVFCQAGVEPQDKLDGTTVLAVMNMLDKHCDLIGVEVYL